MNNKARDFQRRINASHESASDTPAAVEATVARKRPKPSTYPSPDRIWLQETTDGDGLDMFWYSARPDGTLEPDLINPAIEYILRSSADAQLSKLREALRQTAGHYHVAQKHGDGLVIAPFRDCDNPVCAAARTAITKGTKG